MEFSRITKRITHNARLHPSVLVCRGQFEDPVHVLRVVEDDRDVAALAGEARSCAARKPRRAVFAACCQGSDDIRVVLGYDDTYWRLPVVGSVGCIHRTRGTVEADVSADDAL